jgi:hypothetical protein
MLQINLADAEIRLRDLLEILIAANMIEAVKQTLRTTCWSTLMIVVFVMTNKF